MVVIRLARSGAKKRPFYHIVAADNRSPVGGSYIERLGYFNPIASGKEVPCHMNFDRIQYWLAQGAQPSQRIKHLLKNYRTSV
jgi:small subunit ribosomal protein S16